MPTWNGSVLISRIITGATTAGNSQWGVQKEWTVKVGSCLYVYSRSLDGVAIGAIWSWSRSGRWEWVEHAMGAVWALNVLLWLLISLHQAKYLSLMSMVCKGKWTSTHLEATNVSCSHSHSSGSYLVSSVFLWPTYLKLLNFISSVSRRERVVLMLPNHP